MVRHPVGGVLSDNLQLLTGCARPGHDVHLPEKAGHEDSCFDPERRTSSDDCTCGFRRVGRLLEAHAWPVTGATSADGSYHGMSRRHVEELPPAPSPGGHQAQHGHHRFLGRRWSTAM